MRNDCQPTMRELYDLALEFRGMLERGFARIDQRLVSMEKHLDGVGGLIGSIEERMTSIECSVSRIERWTLKISKRITAIESRSLA